MPSFREEYVLVLNLQHVKMLRFCNVIKSSALRGISSVYLWSSYHEFFLSVLATHNPNELSAGLYPSDIVNHYDYSS